MPIDARIALGAQAPQIAQPMELYGNALKLQSMQRQNALAEQEMATAQTNQRRQAELLNFMQSAKDPYAEDVQMQLPRFGQPGIDMATKLEERNRYRSETKVKQAEYEAKTLEAAQAMMPAAVNDPNQYARVIEFVRSRDPAMADRMPPWSKEGVLNLMTTAKDMVAQHRMTAEQQSMATDRAEQRGISRGQLDVARGNLGVARDRLAFDQGKVKTDIPLDEAARQRALGETQAKFETAAPNAISDATQALGLIDQMIGTKPYIDKATGGRVQEKEPHPGFSGAVGFGIGQRYVPGTNAASFQALFDQVQGGAFLQAFETLRGGGAITEKEGAKATAAKNRMSLAQDEKSFIAAAREYQDVLREGIKRAQARLQGGAPTGGGAVQVKTDADYDSLPSGTLFIDPNGEQRRKP